MNTWDLIKNERLRLVDLGETLPPSAWARQSLCEAWTVQDVFAHLVVPLVTPTFEFMLAMVKAGGNFDRASEALASRRSASGPTELLKELRSHASSHFTPPGLGAAAPLTDVIVHTQDIAIPLGIDVAVDVSTVTVALDFVTSRSAALGFIPRGRLKGIRLMATDSHWVYGSGELVEGPSRELLLGVCGRKVAFPALTGSGVAELADRSG